ncbi:nose resistant to fluoxetine protein 6-like [Adelges cooleyi]|uniref:nose resistant to fluoxetine protein 6-like n=1 Tax=Adelges cooleyi TaxID=133065 RepID=UPI0021802E12|nr:nose resistant to fluoxetine protein 6-like [Adelges cooleyi]XP_050428679.1 nose resistant to fluoxetine protein 6-like [Adelges cooleyi]
MLVYYLVYTLSVSTLSRADVSIIRQQTSYGAKNNYGFPSSSISDMYYKAFADFTVQSTDDSACHIQTDLYVRHLRNNTYWAVRMAESWNRYPSGLLAGDNYQLGVYDECVDVASPVQGQYCLADIKLYTATKKDYTLNRPDYPKNTDNAWHQILGWVDYSDQFPRNLLKIGICIPAACSALDLQNSLQTELNKVFNPEQVNAVVRVDPIMCTTSKDTYPYTSGYYITCAAIAILLFVCCVATFYHFAILLKTQSSKATNVDDYRMYETFSIIKNAKDLLKYDLNNELNIIYGFKVGVMVSVLFGHRLMYFIATPLSYPEPFERIYVDGPSILLTSMNLVDPFFYMTGFVTYILLKSTFQKPGSWWLKLTTTLAYRFARLVPSYGLVMAFTAHVLPHLGNGPLWPLKTWQEAENCQKYWWTNLVFINNYIDAKYQCLIISWYVSCDFQFLVVGIIVILIYTKRPKLGVGLLTVLLVISLFAPFYTTIVKKVDGLVKVLIPALENVRSSRTFDEVYRSSYLRAVPYLVGLAVSMLVETLKERKFKLPMVVVYTGTFVVTVVGMWIQLYGAIFYQRHRPYNALEHALYATFHHFSWTLISVWISICCFTTGYGPLAKVFSNRFMVTLGKLSYHVFMVNLTVMLMSSATQRLPVHWSFKSLVDAWIYDSIRTYLMAAALYLIVDAPFSDIIRIAFGRRNNDRSNNTVQPNIVSAQYNEPVVVAN